MGLPGSSHLSSQPADRWFGKYKFLLWLSYLMGIIGVLAPVLSVATVIISIAGIKNGPRWASAHFEQIKKTLLPGLMVTFIPASLYILNVYPVLMAGLAFILWFGFGGRTIFYMVRGMVRLWREKPTGFYT